MRAADGRADASRSSGRERADLQYPFGDLLRAGARLAMGSDWSVTTANPLEQIEVAVTRVDPEHRDNAPFLPEQAAPPRRCPARLHRRLGVRQPRRGRRHRSRWAPGRPGRARPRPVRRRGRPGRRRPGRRSPSPRAGSSSTTPTLPPLLPPPPAEPACSLPERTRMSSTPNPAPHLHRVLGLPALVLFGLKMRSHISGVSPAPRRSIYTETGRLERPMAKRMVVDDERHI